MQRILVADPGRMPLPMARSPVVVDMPVVAEMMQGRSLGMAHVVYSYNRGWRSQRC